MIGSVSIEPGDIRVQNEATLEPGKTVRLIEYNAYSLSDKRLDQPENFAETSLDTGVRWLHLQGRPGVETIERLASQFRFHPLTLATFKSDPGRPRVEAHDRQLSIVLQIASTSPTGTLTIEPLHLFLQDQFVVTLLANTALDPFRMLRERISDNADQLRFLRSDYLVYSIFEATLEPYAASIAQLQERRECLEQAVLRDPAQELLPPINQTQRTVAQLRQVGVTQVEVWRALAEDQTGAIGDRTKPFFRSGYLRLLEMIDRLETEVSAAANLSNLYLASVSSRTSESIRRFAMIASICLPIITITLLYAMSFLSRSPTSSLRRWHDTYPLFILLLLACAVVCFWQFRRRR
ncbi:MAG TPA: CorA family divalent cation transporter [Chthoniobacterales bacterium]|nr:CorA family divalent cation transporter [Chthoniobacterales bacterium]